MATTDHLLDTIVAETFHHLSTIGLGLAGSAPALNQHEHPIIILLTRYDALINAVVLHARTFPPEWRRPVPANPTVADTGPSFRTITYRPTNSRVYTNLSPSGIPPTSALSGLAPDPIDTLIHLVLVPYREQP